jgi:hypothetical protein
MPRLHLPALAAAAAIVALLSGCAGGTPTPTASPLPTASPSPTATTTPSPAASVDPNAPSGQCADDALSVSISGGDGGAGSIGYDLVFTNTGSAECELRGAPGVSVIDGAGTQLGEPAEQVGDDAPDTLTLQPGGSVTAPLTAVNIDPDGGPLDDCPVVHGTGYRVFPPHSFTGFVVDANNVPACDSSTVFLKVGPVQVS